MMVLLLCVAIWMLDLDASFYEDIHYYLVDMLGYSEQQADTEIAYIRRIGKETFIRSGY